MYSFPLSSLSFFIFVCVIDVFVAIWFYKKKEYVRRVDLWGTK